ncbi:OmpA family protein [Brachyspira aalborgi]|uniref:OmpA family protein n=1 Tax=Brachyspira aalborgi TaxID=29522 RepID=A0A5C8EGY5_9SPIR|nr:OmpA family protein [Brachyspira aalborgi]TXJ36728.1 OmpA family protein [Brachyspira aalborgi]
MLKKVFIIIILPFAFYSCSSIPATRNSTIVLYLSHNIEGPIYIPRADSGKKPVDNTKSSYSKTSKKEKTKKDTSKGQNKTDSTKTYNGYQTRETDGRGEMLILEKPIRFAFEKYNITSDYNESIKYVADYLKENTNVRMVVEGHTDRVGPKEFNKGLSLRRSRAAITKLTRTGIKRDRLIPSGVNSRFLEYNLNRLNRRVEFIIIRSDEDLTNYINKVK